MTSVVVYYKTCISLKTSNSLLVVNETYFLISDMLQKKKNIKQSCYNAFSMTGRGSGIYIYIYIPDRLGLIFIFF